MKTLVLTVLLASLPCTAQNASDKTEGQRNGRFWNSVSATSKTYWLVGFDEGFGLGHELGRGSVLNRAFPWAEKKTNEQRIRTYQEGWRDVDQDRGHYLPSTMSFGEIVTGMDRFYSEPENLVIPMVEGLEIFTIKANGATPAAVESKLAAFREHNIKAAEEEQKKKAGGQNP